MNIRNILGNPLTVITVTILVMLLSTYIAFTAETRALDYVEECNQHWREQYDKLYQQCLPQQFNNPNFAVPDELPDWLITPK